MREALDELELRSYVKTSGSEGIHILVPDHAAVRATTGRTRSPSSSRSGSRRRTPASITTEWLKRKRVGVLIDFHQNGAGRTIASAYSVRPKEGAPVSTPLRWEELTPRLDPGKFTMEAVLRRVEKEGDLFEPVLQGGQSLGAALRRLERHSATQATRAQAEPDRRQQHVEDEDRGDEDRPPERPSPLRHGR